MVFIALIPGFFSAVVVFFRSPGKALLNVYLPALIVLPQIVAQLPSFPDFNISAAAIIPIAFFCLITRFNKWKFSIMDVLVLLYIFFCVYSEHINTGTEHLDLREELADNLLFSMMTAVAFPYFLAKLLIHSRGVTVVFAKRIVLLMVINLLICAYEWRMVVNLHKFFISKLFPGQIKGVPSFRYGLVRLEGPFFHPILFGIMIGVVLFFSYWLIKNKFWRKKLTSHPSLLAWLKEVTIFLILFIGLIMTWSRGPLFSTILGALFVGVGFVKRRWKSLFWRVLLLGVLAIIALEYYQHYSFVGRDHATSEMASSAAYRTELVREYEGYILEKPFFGWGQYSWPKVRELQSIDNQYLWLILKHGFVATGLFVAITCWIMMRLLIKGMYARANDTINSSLAFTFFSIYLMMSASLATVYMGGQIEPVFFLLAGWVEGYLLTKSKSLNQSLLTLKPCVKTIAVRT